jgi:molybdopterin-guanine dinucleotide biosynthesis protein A
VITAIVLAGGRASRMGGAKLDIRIEGRSLLELAVAAVAQVADEIVVAGPPAAELTTSTLVPIRFVEDEEPAEFPGPLRALAGALERSNGDRGIVVAGDMPFLAPRVLASMLDRLVAEPTIDAVLLESPGAEKRQVLPLAIGIETVAAAAREALAEGDRSLVRLLDRIGGVEIPASEWQALDPAARTLVDIDEAADLERWTRR